MKLTLSAMDVLAPTTMKNAAKCDTSCELQNPVSHQNFERTLHFFGSMSVGVSVLTHPKTLAGFWEPTSYQTNLFGVSVLRWGACRPSENASLRALESPSLSYQRTMRRHVMWTNALSDWEWLRSVLCETSARTSNQSRIPAEFKHITRRRKRN